MSDCTLQLHAYGAWHDVASVRLHGGENEGWKAKSYAGYAVDWAFEHIGKNDAHALCARWPVGLEPLQLPHWPVFLIDLLPQGFGRQELLRRIGRVWISTRRWPLRSSPPFRLASSASGPPPSVGVSGRARSRPIATPAW